MKETNQQLASLLIEININSNDNDPIMKRSPNK